MIRKGIDHLGASEDMEADEKDVVRKQHTATEFVCKSAFPKYLKPEVTDILDMTIVEIPKH